MKRPIAIVLTIAIFAAIAVCFLRPIDENPDFGYADRFDGRHIPLELEGESEYFAEAAVGIIDPVDPFINVILRPKEPYCLTPGNPRITKDGEPDPYNYENFGFIERFVDGTWEYVCETAPGGMYQMIGVGSAKYHSISWDGDSLYGWRFPFYAPIFDTPGEYRFTMNFRIAEQIDETWVAGSEPHSISFRYTIPEVSGKAFDVLAVRTLVNGDRKIAWINLRKNHSIKWPFVLQDGEWTPNTSYFDSETITMYATWDVDGDKCTLQLAEHSDGSGERYTLTLHLWFDE